MDERTFLKAWVLYSVHKRTLTQCAEALYDETMYASVDSLRMGIYRRFRKQGLPLRRSGPQTSQEGGSMNINITRQHMSNVLADNGYLTTTEVAQMLDITPRRVAQHAQAGDIEPAGTAGRTLVFTIEDAEGLLAFRAERGYRVPASYKERV